MKRFALLEKLFPDSRDYNRKQRVMRVFDKHPEIELDGMLELVEELINALKYKRKDY